MVNKNQKWGCWHEKATVDLGALLFLVKALSILQF